jgi:hypothetical protein
MPQNKDLTKNEDLGGASKLALRWLAFFLAIKRRFHTSILLSKFIPICKRQFVTSKVIRILNISLITR